ncbi:MAG: hypothetical protein JOY87_11930 [Candidatus Eremiobacteraeota bacterium]|nr:hypothetical protein [Candidatus Eremiobacteraeota bacterium]
MTKLTSIEALEAAYQDAYNLSETAAAEAEIDAAIEQATLLLTQLTQISAKTPADAAAKIAVALTSLRPFCRYEPAFELLETVLSDLQAMDQVVNFTP